MATTFRVAGIKKLRLGYANGSAVAYVQIPYGNRFTMSTAVQNITYEGDNTTLDVFSSADLTGTLAADKLSDDVILKAFGKSATSSLGSSIASRIYFGENAEFTASPVELEVTLAAVRDDVTPAVAYDIKIRVFSATIKPFKPGDMANRAKVPFDLEWAAAKTEKDVAGNALPQLPSSAVGSGVTYSIDYMTTVE